MHKMGMPPPGHWKYPAAIKSEQLSVYAEEKIEREQKKAIKSKIILCGLEDVSLR